jgi:hypothetical protein
MTKSMEVEFKVGRRSTDGIVRLSSYPPALLQLSVSYRGERSASVVLTREQVQALRQALTEFENEIPPANDPADTWDNHERRIDEPVTMSDGH